MKSIGLGLLRAALGVALLAYVFTSPGSAIPPLSSAAPWIAAFAAFTLPGALIEALRLRLLLAAQGLELSLGLGMRIVTIGTFFSFCIPGGTGGDLMKIFYLASANRGRGVELTTIVLVDRVIGLVSLLCLVLLLALPNLGTIREHGTILVLVSLAASSAIVVCLFGILAVTRGESAAERLRGMHFPFKAYFARALEALGCFRGHGLALLYAVALSLAGQVVLMMLFAGAARDITAAHDGVRSAFLAALGMFANAVPITPGGLGVGEYAFERLFALTNTIGAELVLLTWRVGLLPIAIAGAVLYAKGVQAERTALEPVRDAPSSDS
jgi:uncharacterized membrane protein YbhN (UPF0104 family)